MKSAPATPLTELVQVRTGVILAKVAISPKFCRAMRNVVTRTKSGLVRKLNFFKKTFYEENFLLVQGWG